MKKILSITLLVVLSMYSCKQSREDQIKSISKLEAEVKETFKTTIDEKLAAKLIDAYASYIEEFKKDSLKADYCFMAGDLAYTANDPRRSIHMFQTFIMEYPTDPRVPEAIIMIAVIYQNKLNMLDNAEIFYKQIIEKYPSSRYVEIARLSLESMTATPQELINQP